MEQLPLVQDIEGRIANLNWKPSTQWALPILEAVSNSLYATSHLKNEDQQIRITLIREGDDQVKLQTDKQRERPIIGFRVEDNGVGFNEENFEAFKTIDTRHKRDYGGKGVGRLFWLKAFTSVSIRSVYHEKEEVVERNIAFSPSRIEHETRTLEFNTQNITTVEVKNLKPTYKRYYKKLASTVAKEIVEEFLPYFILNGWPRLFTVSFTDCGENEINIFDSTNYSDTRESFILGPHAFDIIHVKNYQHDRHKVYYCAAERVVSEHKTNFSEVIPKRQLTDSDGSKYWYMGLISSKYLTDNISTERSNFLIPEKPNGYAQLDSDKDVSLADIDEKAASLISKYLAPSLENAQNETTAAIAKVLDENPELKVIPFSDEDVNTLISSGENEIKKKFREKLHEHLDNSQEEIEALIKRVGTEETIDFDKFHSEFEEEVKRYSLLNQSHVVSYILYRKHVLELFEKALTVFSGDKIAKEDFIHNLIFPMRQQGAPADFGTNHNLWLIDDRLSMVEWVASDVPISKHNILRDSNSKKEPDIVFYNMAYSDDANLISNSTYSEIHIVEFKRPLTLSNDPVKQINQYIYNIKKSKILHLSKTPEGYKETSKKLRVSDNTMFYGYVIFDLNEIRHTDKWEFMMLNNKLKPFMNGYISQDDNILIFIDSFENILKIAKKRNEIFFKKLTAL